jgi:formate hydrogenlyase transcriptional activator
MDDAQPKRAKGNLLVVDDDLSARQTMEAFLTREGYEVRCAPNGQMALMFAEKDPPELILLDVRLPDTDGFQVCRRLKEDPQTGNIPVIFISGLDEVVDKMKGFAAGGVDYITKPFQAEEVLARVQTHLTLRRLQKQVEAQNARLEQEIIKSRRAEEQIKQAAEEWRKTFDSITDLVSIHDRDFRIVRANHAFAAAFGLEISAVLGKECFEIIHRTEEPPPECPHRQTMVSGKPVTEEFFESRLGRYVQVSASPILNVQNEVIGSVHIVKDITERKRAEEALRKAHDELEKRVKERTADLARANEQLVASEKALGERLKFETALAEISARFVNLPADRIDDEIRDSQRRVCELFDFDRSTLWQTSDREPGIFLLTHLHQPPGSPTAPEPMDAREYFPWATQKILSGEIIAISRMADLPPEAARDQEVLRPYGTKSTLVLPLSPGGGSVFGMMSFAVVREERKWPEQTVKELQLVAQVFANALARKRMDEALRESEARLSLAAESGEIGLWSVGLRDGHIWGTEKGWQLLGLPPGSQMSEESFYNMVHPEDRERVRETMEQAVQSGKNARIEYRVIIPDGSVRWRISHSRPHFTGTGEADRLTGATVDVTDQKQMEKQLQMRLTEIEDLKQRLEQENIYLREEINLQHQHKEIVGQSGIMKQVLLKVEQVSQTDSTVLIQGETGTGKELLARAIHQLSKRKDKPLVTVNCASLPPTLIESELFGREKGAYTGALTRMIGRFEVADGATIFLDEIGEIPPEIQAKLLRVLEEGRFERLGSTKTCQVNVRIIAATNRDLTKEVDEGRFRKDLFYRLNVFPITVPPLRERPEDIPLLAWAFVREFEKRMGKRIDAIPRKRMEALQRYPWPGNVRELRNVIEHAMIVSNAKTLVVDPPQVRASETLKPRNLEDMERGHILSVLEKVGWRIAGSGGAAEVLGLNRTTLQFRMKKLGITRPTVSRRD